MRKRFHDFRVCSCSPEGKMLFMDAQTLQAIIKREIHPIRCAASCGRKAQKGILLGDLCAEAHHPLWALRIWWFVIEQIHDKDYDDWIGVWFNPRYVSFGDVISTGLCELLGRRIDDLERRSGLSDAKGIDSIEYWVGDGWYDGFRYEKYDNDWATLRESYIRMRDEAIAQQATDRLFKEGQGLLPPQSQDFFHYWQDFDPTVQNLYFKIDDWS